MLSYWRVNPPKQFSILSRDGERIGAAIWDHIGIIYNHKLVNCNVYWSIPLEILVALLRLFLPVTRNYLDKIQFNKFSLRGCQKRPSAVSHWLRVRSFVCCSYRRLLERAHRREPLHRTSRTSTCSRLEGRKGQVGKDRTSYQHFKE